MNYFGKANSTMLSKDFFGVREYASLVIYFFIYLGNCM